MTNILMSLLLALSTPLCTSLYAHELDRRGSVTPDQMSMAADLPLTLVIRTNRADRRQVETLHLKERLAKGQKLDKVRFDMMAANAEIPKIAYNSGNELDVTTSKSSWAFGLGLLGLGAGLFLGSSASSRAYAGSYYNPYSSSYNQSYYPSSSGYSGYGYGAANYYRPYYRYAGYNYGYNNYYNYYSSADNCDYGYYNWNQGGN